MPSPVELTAVVPPKTGNAKCQLMPSPMCGAPDQNHIVVENSLEVLDEVESTSLSDANLEAPHVQPVSDPVLGETPTCFVPRKECANQSPKEYHQKDVLELR